MGWLWSYICLNSSILFKHVLILSMFLNQSEKANYRWERFCLHTDIFVISSDVNRNNRKKMHHYSAEFREIFGALELSDWHHHAVVQSCFDADFCQIPHKASKCSHIITSHQQKNSISFRTKDWTIVSTALIKWWKWSKKRLTNCKNTTRHICFDMLPIYTVVLC